MKRHSFKDWFFVTRPWSYPASVMPVLVVIAYVFWLSSRQIVPADEISWINGALALVVMALFQAWGNVWSDLHDYESGVDTDESYGVKILTSGEYTPAEIRRLAMGLGCAALLLGVCLCFMAGPLTVAFGIAGMALTVFYPKLKYNALGDLDIFLAYGILPALGTAYVLTGTMVWSTLLLAVPVGSITVAILHVNNTRDVHTDAKAHIRTLAMLIGYKASRIGYIAEILVPFAIICLLVAFSVLPVWSLLSLVALVPALKNTKAMRSSSAANLSSIVALDAATAQLQLAFSLLLSLSLVIAFFVK